MKGWRFWILIFLCFRCVLDGRTGWADPLTANGQWGDIPAIEVLPMGSGGKNLPPGNICSQPKRLAAASGWLDSVKGLLDPKIAHAAYDHLITMGKAATPSLKQMLRGNNLLSFEV